MGDDTDDLEGDEAVQIVPLVPPHSELAVDGDGAHLVTQGRGQRARVEPHHRARDDVLRGAEDERQLCVVCRSGEDDHEPS
eukprot:CAMPEP_0183367252 /NCGR_PEP_ID=MMETSP0164_2-20130417/91806_1 /TAXON_ID=221442 /ORGANISM="Coccolithus pelagicus ssp braarudi, Strain PLY182g" /LENGTH=80 /DNA_ID=CAMNT_0025543155 /DNA_START=149 /DNA_END=388 /DNA_ORIENTATION=+